MKRDELLKSPEYWTANLQMELYQQVAEFMDKRGMNKTQLAEYLGCSKGYITQLLSGDYDHKMSNFMELALAIGKIPEVTFKDVDRYNENDSCDFNAIINYNASSEYTTDKNNSLNLQGA